MPTSNFQSIRSQLKPTDLDLYCLQSRVYPGEGPGFQHKTERVKHVQKVVVNYKTC